MRIHTSYFAFQWVSRINLKGTQSIIQNYIQCASLTLTVSVTSSFV